MISESILQGVNHVSFDVWNTLVVPNPEYAAARNQYLALLFNKPVEEVKAQYTKTKRVFDQAAEYNGESTPIRQVFARLYNDMGAPCNQLVLHEVEIGCHALFRRYPPGIVPGMVEMLQQLSAKGYTISIASNTNFISGEMMRSTVFDDMEVKFDFQLYSDELGCSKPHIDFFLNIGIAANNAHIKRGNYKLLPSNILHVGDNHVCDVFGAHREGMKALLVKDPQHTVELLTAALK